MSDSDKKKEGVERNEDEIATKQITIGYKRFYVDVKQNPRGRFIKIAEMGNAHKQRVVMSMNIASQIVDKMDEYIAYGKTNPAETNHDDKETVELKSDVINTDSRRYYLDLKENNRGRFLRIAQTTTVPRRPRSQVAIPSDGFPEVRDVIAEFIKKYGEGFMDATSTDLMESKQVRTDFNKTFYMDVQQNDRGQFIRISEVKGPRGFRNSITIPCSALVGINKNLSEIINHLSLDSKTDVEA